MVIMVIPPCGGATGDILIFPRWRLLEMSAGVLVCQEAHRHHRLASVMNPRVLSETTVDVPALLVRIRLR